MVSNKRVVATGTYCRFGVRAFFLKSEITVSQLFQSTFPQRVVFETGEGEPVTARDGPSSSPASVTFLLIISSDEVSRVDLDAPWSVKNTADKAEA
jgi:hypothetical protein